MIIDAGGYLGNFPFRKLNRTEPLALAKYAFQSGITHMLVSSIEAVFYKDVTEGNNILSEKLDEYEKNAEKSVRFIPFAVVNPKYPGWEKDMVHQIHHKGFAGIDLFPQYHGYSLKDQCGAAVLQLAESLEVPVRIANGFENIRQRADLDVKADVDWKDLIFAAEKCKNVKFIFIGFNSLGIAKEVKDRNLGNVYYDFARSDVFPGVISDMLEIISDCSADRLCFSSFSPIQYIEPQLIKLTSEKISKTDKRKILWENLMKVLKIRE